MSSRLRKMMDKRRLKGTPTDPADMEAHSSSDVGEVQASPTKQSNLDVPAPPAAKVKANEEAARKVSPSKTLLDRYKTRSATSLTASPPTTIRIPPASPQDDTDTGSPSPKGTTFRPDFDHNVDPLANAANSANAEVTGKGKGKARADVEAPAQSDVEMKRKADFEKELNRNEENISPATRPRTPEQQLKSRRTTRSFVRRQERADSKQDSQIASKDFAGRSLGPADVPPGLNIRKDAASRSPSPSSSKSNLSDPWKEAISTPLPTDLDTPASPQSLQSEDPIQRPATPTGSDSGSPKPAIPPRSPKRNRIPSFKIDAAKDVSIKEPTSSSRPPLSTPLSPTVPKDSPVAVRPPLYDASKPALFQWQSDLGSSSRPPSPWMHSKRWMCCLCQGKTIVEQTVCSRLTCVHDRCPSRCRLEKKELDRGPFQLQR